MGKPANTVPGLLDRCSWEGDCLVYPKAHSNGYVEVSVNGRLRKLHQHVIEDQCGPIPEGKEIHHLCSNKRCCNPAHLQIVTHAEHAALDKHPVKNSKKFCVNGHAYTPENSRVNELGYRECRTCRSYGNRRARQLQRQKDFGSQGPGADEGEIGEPAALLPGNAASADGIGDAVAVLPHIDGTWHGHQEG